MLKAASFSASLAAGTYVLEAFKGGWQVGFHSRDPMSRHPHWIAVADGARAGAARIALRRRASVSGRVLGAGGQPLAGVEIGAYEPVAIEGRRRYRQVGWEHTDDRGEYFLSLRSGEYVIGAEVPLFSMDGPKLPKRDGQTFVYQSTFYPDALAAAGAAAVVLGAGDERAGLDIQLRETRGLQVTANVTGDSFFADGMRLWAENDRLESSPARRFSIDAAGQSRATGVPAGAYLLRVIHHSGLRTPVAGASITIITSPVLRTAERRIVLTDQDAVLTMPLNDAATVSGTTRFLDGEPPALSTLQQHPIALRDLDDRGDDGSGVFQSDGRFKTAPMSPGRYLFTSTAPDGWRLQSVMAGTRDVADQPLEVGTIDVDDLVMTFTRRPAASVSGRITDGGALERQVMVVAFPADSDLWRGLGPSRRILRSVTGRLGTFALAGLPAGTYHVVAIEREAWRTMQTPEGFQAMAAASTTIVVNDGETRSIDLRVMAGRP